MNGKQDKEQTMNVRMTMMAVLTVFGMAVGNGLAEVVAADEARNYDPAAWVHESNKGSGFEPWNFASDNGGHFIGDAAAQGVQADISTSGRAFGLWTMEGHGYANAWRRFSEGALKDGQTLSFDLAFQYDNGSKGVDLIQEDAGTIFNFNITTGEFQWTDGHRADMSPWEGEREFGETVSFRFTQVGEDLEYEITTRSGSMEATGTVRGVNPNEVGFYVVGAGGDPGGNLYFNNLKIAP